MKRILAVLAVACAGAAPALASQDHAQAADKKPAAATAPSTDAMADGEVKKVDKGAGKVTIKHGPLPTLDMPAMTMVFRVKDAAMLDKVKAGDAIKFKAEKIGGNYTVTEYQPAK